MIRVISIAALLVPAPALAAEQFDLACRGGEDAWHYRVDLAKSEWCADNCDRVFKLASVTSGTLVLQDKDEEFRGGDVVKNTISRADGRWYFYRRLPKIGFSKTIEGQCQLQPFSGMPSAKF